jgi:hypothetical protein
LLRFEALRNNDGVSVEAPNLVFLGAGMCLGVVSLEGCTMMTSSFSSINILKTGDEKDLWRSGGEMSHAPDDESEEPSVTV